MKYLIAATSYMGKSSAHHAGALTDPEELEELDHWKKGWADPRKANDPAWRAANYAAYTKAVDQLLIGPTPIVATHPDPAIIQQAAAAGRTILVLRPSTAAYRRAIDKHAMEQAEGAAHAKQRWTAFLRGADAAEKLAKAGYPALLCDHVESALRHLHRVDPTVPSPPDMSAIYWASGKRL